MKRVSLCMAAMSALFGAASCGPRYTAPTDASQTGFDISFFKAVNESSAKDENVVTSPYSAGVALSMLAEGAGGQTRVEFDNALGGLLFKAEDLGGSDSVTVRSTNSVWVSDNFSIRNRYVGLLEKDFDAFITTQNFADPATVKAINDWCSEHTEGKIDNILDRLDPSSVMVLVNALYFNAPWELPFDASRTSDQTFHGRNGATKVKMMHKRAHYSYAEYQGCQMVRLPYEGGRYSMYVVLPPRGMDIDRMLPYVNESAFKSAMDMLSPKDVVLDMPKFKVETSMVLNDALQAMGIRTAFTSAADFTAIAELGPLVLNQVKQKCFINVSETGTEAAAVTMADIRLTSLRPTEELVRMTVDRPFVFFIADAQDGDILFAGKIINL